MLFVIKQANQDGSASATAGMAQQGDAGLRLILQEERQESEEDRLHSGSLWRGWTWPSCKHQQASLAPTSGPVH